MRGSQTLPKKKSPAGGVGSGAVPEVSAGAAMPGEAAGEGLEALAKQVRGLTAADKLRLAAGLLDVDPPRLSIAARLVDDVAVELGAVQLLTTMRERKGNVG